MAYRTTKNRKYPMGMAVVGSRIRHPIPRPIHFPYPIGLASGFGGLAGCGRRVVVASRQTIGAWRWVVVVEVLNERESQNAPQEQRTDADAPGKGLTPKWRKIYRGRIHYFRGSYDDAIAQWELLKVKLDKETEQNEFLTPYEHFRSLMEYWGASHVAHACDDIIAKYPPLIEWIVSTFVGSSVYKFTEDNPQFAPFLIAYEGEDYYRPFIPIVIDDTVKSRFSDPEQASNYFDLVWKEVEQHFKDNYREGTQQTTIALATEQFLARQKAKVSGGLRSSGRYELLKRCLSHFREFIGGRAGTDRLNAVSLEAYHSTLLGEMKNGWTPDYAVLYMGAAKQFIRWAWRKELIPNLPRNIDDSDLSIETTPKKLKTFSKEEMHFLFSLATERTKLYLLLMLNAGMTQKDIADLTREEVDLDQGWIERKRSKTKKQRKCTDSPI